MLAVVTKNNMQCTSGKVFTKAECILPEGFLFIIRICCVLLNLASMMVKVNYSDQLKLHQCSLNLRCNAISA